MISSLLLILFRVFIMFRPDVNATRQNAKAKINDDGEFIVEKNTLISQRIHCNEKMHAVFGHKSTPIKFILSITDLSSGSTSSVSAAALLKDRLLNQDEPAGWRQWARTPKGEYKENQVFINTVNAHKIERGKKNSQ